MPFNPNSSHFSGLQNVQYFIYVPPAPGTAPVPTQNTQTYDMPGNIANAARRFDVIFLGHQCTKCRDSQLSEVMNLINTQLPQIDHIVHQFIPSLMSGMGAQHYWNAGAAHVSQQPLQNVPHQSANTVVARQTKTQEKHSTPDTALSPSVNTTKSKFHIQNLFKKAEKAGSKGKHETSEPGTSSGNTPTSTGARGSTNVGSSANVIHDQNQEIYSNVDDALFSFFSEKERLALGDDPKADRKIIEDRTKQKIKQAKDEAKYYPDRKAEPRIERIKKQERILLDNLGHFAKAKVKANLNDAVLSFFSEKEREALGKDPKADKRIIGDRAKRKIEQAKDEAKYYSDRKAVPRIERIKNQRRILLDHYAQAKVKP